MQEQPLPDKIAMVSFFASGALSMMFGLFSVLGTAMGGLATGAFFLTLDEDMLIGPIILVFYGLWMVVCLVVGALHLYAGYALATRKPKGGWMWAAAGSGLALAVTFYCAPFGLLSAVLGVWAILQDSEHD